MDAPETTPDAGGAQFLSIDDFFAFAQRIPLYGGQGEAIVTVLIVLLLISLPPKERFRRIRLTIVFVLLHFVVAAMRLVFPENSHAHHSLRYLSLFFLLAAIARSFVMLVVRWLLHPFGIHPPQIFLDVVNGLAYAFVLGLTLSAAGVEPTNLFAGSAAVTVVVGFALRDTLGNLISGLAIQAQQPFYIGDWIQFDEHAEHVGKVVEINWRATKLLTTDAVEVILPNSKLAEASIKNFTRPEPWSCRTVRFYAPYNIQPQRVRRLVMKGLYNCWGVLRDPRPDLITDDFRGRRIRYRLLFYTDMFELRDQVESSVRERILTALARHDIRMAKRRQDGPEQGPSPTEKRYEQWERLLSSIDIFQTLTLEQMKSLLPSLSEQTYAAGEPIVVQGETGDELFVIEKGEAVMTVHRKKGRDIEIARLRVGMWFGEMALLTGQRRTATVTAVDDCRVLVVEKRDLQQLIEETPQLAESLGAILSQRQADLLSLLSDTDAGIDSAADLSHSLADHIRRFFAGGAN